MARLAFLGKLMLCGAAGFVAALSVALPTASAQTPIDKFIDCTDAFWQVHCAANPDPAPEETPAPDPSTPIDKFIDCTDAFWRVHCAGNPDPAPEETPAPDPSTPIDKFIDCTDIFWDVYCSKNPPSAPAEPVVETVDEVLGIVVAASGGTVGGLTCSATITTTQSDGSSVRIEVDVPCTNEDSGQTIVEVASGSADEVLGITVEPELIPAPPLELADEVLEVTQDLVLPSAPLFTPLDQRLGPARPATFTADAPASINLGATDVLRIKILHDDDWRPEAAAFNPTGIIRTEGDGRLVQEVAVYLTPGRIELTVVAGPGVELLDNGEAVRVLTEEELVRRGSPATYDWDIRALTVGPSYVIVTGRYIEQASSLDPLDDEELAQREIDRLEMRFDFEVIPTSTGTVMGPIPAPEQDFPIWLLGVLALLAIIPAASLLAALGRGRSPKGRGKVHDLTEGAGQGDLGVVLSGGGLRATAFSLGILEYLSDADQFDEVAQIASVSGGSIANGYLATIDDDGNKLDFGRLAHRVAHRGLPFERSLAVLAVTWIVAAALCIVTRQFLVLGAFLAIAWLTYTWLGVRFVLPRWMAKIVGTARDTQLADAGIRDISHVFTATDSSGNHAHFSPTAVIVADAGDETSPGKAELIEVVQASAAFPSLPPVKIPFDRLDFDNDKKGKLRLIDGGAVNNLGHVEKTVIDADSPAFLNRNGQIQRWIVVNSSAPRSHKMRAAWATESWIARMLDAFNLGVTSDAAGLLGTNASNDTADTVKRLEKLFDEQNNGILIGLEDSPVELCVAAIDDAAVRDRIVAGSATGEDLVGGTEAEQKARRLLDTFIRLSMDATFWNGVRNNNKNLRTTLSSLGEEETASLLQHGYALTLVQGCLHFGWDVPDEFRLTKERFVDMTKAREPTASGTTGTSQRTDSVASEPAVP